MQARRSGWLLVCHRLLPAVLFSIVVILVSGLSVWAQGNYRAQLRGVVSDATGAVVPNATVTIRNIGTNISSAAHTDDKGSYYFTGLLPTTYDVKAEASGFRSAQRTGVVLAVDQESSLNFRLEVAGTLATMIVTTTQPLLDTDNATLGTDITSEYVKELPLLNRSFFGLMFLSAGVTEVAGSGTQENHPSGTNFVSTGSATRPPRCGWMVPSISAPEQGEGGNQRLLRAAGREHAGSESPEQQLLGGLRQQRRHSRDMVMKSGTKLSMAAAGISCSVRRWTPRFLRSPARPQARRQRSLGALPSVGPIKKARLFSSPILKNPQCHVDQCACVHADAGRENRGLLQRRRITFAIPFQITNLAACTLLRRSATLRARSGDRQ